MVEDSGVAETWPLHQNTQERRPTGSLLNIPMLRRSKSGDLRFMRQAWRVVLIVTEEGWDNGRPRVIEEVFWESLLRVSNMTAMAETTSEAVTSLLHTLTVSILPQRKCSTTL